MLVADTNLVAQLILKLEQTETAQNIYRRDPEWVMPELWRHEFLNVLANYLRFDHVHPERLALAWQSANMLFADSARQLDMLLALKLAGERNTSAYDAQRSPLDRRVMRHSQAEPPNLGIPVRLDGT